MEAPAGQTTPPLAPAMQNVMILTTQFFAVYIGVYVGNLLRDIAGMQIDEGIKTIKLCAKTVVFAPMLSVLFLAARMRAEELTDGAGKPQGWVIESMFASTLALATKMLLILIQGALGVNAPKIVQFLVGIISQICQLA